MAKAAEIDVTANEPYGLAAARIVRARTRELFEYDEGVLDTVDIERVHDMRVATRRLRAVLEVFEPCFQRRAYKEALRDVKALADALGERRDPDVHLEAMRTLGGVEPLIERLRERQATGNALLAAALEAAEASDLRGRLLALAGAAEERLVA